MDKIIIYTEINAKKVKCISNDNLNQTENNPFYKKDIKNINDIEIINKKHFSGININKINQKKDFYRRNNELFLSHNDIKFNRPMRKNTKTSTIFFENKNQYKNQIKLNYHQKIQNFNQINILKFIEPVEKDISEEEKSGTKREIKSQLVNNNIIIPVIGIKSKKHKSNKFLDIKNIKNYLKKEYQQNLDDTKNMSKTNKINEISNNYTTNNDQNSSGINKKNSNSNLNNFINLNNINCNIKKNSKKGSNNYLQSNQRLSQPLIPLENTHIAQTIKNNSSEKVLNIPKTTIINTKSFKFKNIFNDPDIIIDFENINEQTKTIKRHNSLNSIKKIEDIFSNLSFQYHGSKNLNRSYSPSKYRRRSSLLWKKVKIFQKMLIGIKNPTVTKIDDNLIFKEDLSNTLLNNNNEPKIITIKKNKKNHVTYSQFVKKNEIEKDFVRISLREKAYKLIMEGVNEKNKNIIEEMENIFSQNPEKNFLPYDKNIFNQKLGNGKTLLYVACQEGCTDLVQFFLNKKLNPNIPVKYFGLEDTCLSAACRWGFYDIVKLLLECKRLDPENISNVYKSNISNSNIKNLLKKYLSKNLNKSKNCKCF